MVFAEISTANSNVNANASEKKKKIKRREELEKEFSAQVRENEGEAANHGIYFDDSNYDYMQHMRELGSAAGQGAEAGEACYIEATVTDGGKGKVKGKVGLVEALRDVNLDDTRSMASGSVASSKAKELLDADMLPSEFVRKKTYQDQQDVPDSIAGFQPDMDPRLREVLEALDDEAYVDDEEDIFAELAQDELVTDERTWEAFAPDVDEDDGWESDDTVKAGLSKGARKNTAEMLDSSQDTTHDDDDDDPAAAATGPDSNDWMAEYNKFKRDTQRSNRQKKEAVQSEAGMMSTYTGLSSLTGKKRRKRKGALTTSSGYSMSSSVLARTEVESLLDSRFDKIEEEYANDDMGDAEDDDGAMSQISGFSKTSRMSNATPKITPAFNSVMDDFLDNHYVVGRSRLKKGPHQTGLEQLDEIRKGLGPAVVRT